MAPGRQAGTPSEVTRPPHGQAEADAMRTGGLDHGGFAERVRMENG